MRTKVTQNYCSDSKGESFAFFLEVAKAEVFLIFYSCVHTWDKLNMISGSLEYVLSSYELTFKREKCFNAVNSRGSSINGIYYIVGPENE